MEDEAKQKDDNGTGIIKKDSQEVSSYMNPATVASFEALVEKLSRSTLAKPFIDKTYPKDEDGKPNYDAAPIESVNTSDMMMCLMIGSDLGMKPMVALSYGRSLNLEAVRKIEFGKKLGLDYATSLEKIYIWPSKGREIMYTAYDVVNKRLIDVGVSKELLEDGTLNIARCLDIEKNVVVDYDPAKHIPVPYGTPESKYGEIITIMADRNPNKIVVVMKPSIRRASMKFTRVHNRTQREETITVSYSSQQAIDAGLLRGIKSDGSKSDGKDNWNSHEATHLIKMCVVTGGRLIAPDALNQVYIPEELPIITKADRDSYEEAQVVG